MYICIYVYMYICIYVYMYICIYVHMILVQVSTRKSWGLTPRVRPAFPRALRMRIIKAMTFSPQLFGCALYL